MMRTPKTCPDLRLAESYISGVIAWGKGMLYTSLCILTHHYCYYGIPTQNNDSADIPLIRALPIVFLYYDHLIWSGHYYYYHRSSFVDCTALSTDVVAGTIAAQFSNLDYTCQSIWCWIIPILWVMHGAGHIFTENHFMHKSLGHVATGLFILLMLLFSGNHRHHENHVVVVVWSLTDVFPYYARAASYLSLVIIDAYTLRPPLQREKDRIGLLRYGAVLFAPTTFLILICGLILLGVLFTKIYLEFWADATAQQQQQQPSAINITSQQPPPTMISGAGTHINNSISNNNNSANNGKSVVPFLIQQQPRNAIDALDVEEAFRLAKLHYMDGKVNV